jgi:hypothetical protein
MCLFPVTAQKQEFGRPKFDPEGDTLIPCGKCHECKTKRASEWAIRCRHEIACHDENCFITLTYDDEHLPSFLVVKDYFQKFMKNLRKKTKKKLKYIVSHEYGERSGRPHHHAIIFGWTPPSQDYLMKAPSGEPLFTSETLENLWTDEKGDNLGYHSIGEANEKTAFYIASYALKSCSRDVTDPGTGEIVSVSDSMNCSTRPAIGFEYFIKHYKTIIQNETLLPRYYKKLLETAKERLERLKAPSPDFIKFANDAETWLQEYENESTVKIRNRSSYEKMSKFKIIEAKKDLECLSMRSAPLDKQSDILLDSLKNDHRDYHLMTKRSQK